MDQAGAGTTITETFYLADNDNEIAEYDVDQGTGALTLLRRYVYSSGVDRPIAMVEETGSSAEVFFYHQDRIGSVVALTDEYGLQVEAHTYSPYGLPDSYAGNAFRFTGRRLDPETGARSGTGLFLIPGGPSRRHRRHGPAGIRAACPHTTAPATTRRTLAAFCKPTPSATTTR